MHQAPPFDPETGDAITVPPATWGSVFREEIVRIGEERTDVVTVTAAMTYPTGLDAFATRFPERHFDVGIAEQHAVTSAAGLALGGLHPVVAIYSTFLTRAIDQILLDVALHRCGVTFVMDRAGVTGDDGPSHNGMWDLSLLGVVPTLRLAAPRDGVRLRELLREAVAVDDAPTALRYPKGPLPEEISAAARVGGTDVIVREGARQVLIVGIGAMVRTCVEVSEKLRAEGIGVTLVDPRWVKPIDAALADLAAQHGLVVTVEDNVRAGGFGSSLISGLSEHGIATPARVHAIPQRFLDHDSRDATLTEVGLTADVIAQDTLCTLRELPQV